MRDRLARQLRKWGSDQGDWSQSLFDSHANLYSHRMNIRAGSRANSSGRDHVGARLNPLLTHALLSLVGLLYLLILWHSLPLNPISVGDGLLFGSSLRRYFSQSWRLFAPNPAVLRTNIYLQLRVKSRTRPEGITETGWIDVDESLMKNMWANPFLVQDTVYRTVYQVILGYREVILRRTSRRETRNVAPIKRGEFDRDAFVTSVYKREVILLAKLFRDLATQEVIQARVAVGYTPIPAVRPLVSATRKENHRAFSNVYPWVAIGDVGDLK